MIFIIEVICIFSVVFLVWHWFRLWTFWWVRGVKTYGYPPPIGCTLPIITGRLTIFQLSKKICDLHPTSPMIGSWILTKPLLIVRDPQLVNQILSEDFATWPSRGILDNTTTVPLTQNLFNISGSQWKLIRSWLASSFGMIGSRDRYNLIVEESNSFARSISGSKQKADFVRSTKESAFTLFCQLSYNRKTLDDPKIVRFLDNVFGSSFWVMLRTVVRLTFPRLLTLFKDKRFDSDLEESIFKLIHHRIQLEHSNQSHNDIFQTLFNAYKQHMISDSDESTFVKIPYESLVSNGIMLLGVGYETTSSTLAWGFLELAKNPDVQDKIHKEIHTVLTDTNGEMDYRLLKKLTYLENVVSEILRMYPALAIALRQSIKPTSIGGVQLPSDMRAIIPIYGMHFSPTDFPEPNKFDPDRFSNGNFNRASFIPFGKGPRICLGLRMSKDIMKTVIATVLKDFTLKLDPSTKLPVRHRQRSMFFTPVDPIILQVKPRKT